MGRTKHHHYVPKGYQAHFASGKLIRRVTKDGAVDRPIGIADNFVRKDVNTVLVDGKPHTEAEEDWARMESSILPAARVAIRNPGDPASRSAVRALMAMQFARSKWFQTVHAVHEAASMARIRKDFVEDPKAVEAFVDDFGVPPKAGELESLVDELVTARERSGSIRVEMMRWMFDRFLEETSRFDIEITRTLGGRANFITSDSPVMMIRTEDDGVRRLGVAFNDADTVAMPLGRDAFAALSNAAGVRFVSTPAVQQLNRLIWANAQEAVALHPDDNLTFCLGAAASWRPPDEPPGRPLIQPPPRSLPRTDS